METSSYLFINKRKRFRILSQTMNKHSSSSSNMSADSLEEDFRRKTSIKGSEENVDTILVPFYERDVLMKVPKELKCKQRVSNRQGRSTERSKSEAHNSSYLVNKRKARRTSYLEMFRKQLAPQQKVEKIPVDDEIRSISPEVGDTERESISEDPNPVTEFYNTESYNEIYYEKLLSRDIENYLDNSFEDYIEDADGKVKNPQDMTLENLKSVSDVSQPRHRIRRLTGPPIENVKLGGLGPDMERIKPRLERARSLQRYSEKVRMENRLKIYKKSLQVENDKADKKIVERESSANRRHSGIEQRTIKIKDDPNTSYLVNKTAQQKSQILTKLYSKSADVKKSRATNSKTIIPKEKSANGQQDYSNQPSAKDKRKSAPEGDSQERAKSSTRSRGINTEKRSEIPPVHINFMVNVGGVRPSSALRTLEEKHRMYQEQVKAFKIENND